MRIIVGILGVLAWIGLVTGLVVILLSYSLVEGRLSVDVLQWTIWPYVILVTVGVICISLIAAGPTVAGELIKLRASLDKIPTNLADLEKIEVRLRETSLNVQRETKRAAESAKRAADEASVAAERTDEASSQIADANLAPEQRPLADRLAKHYKTAKDQYWKIAAAYEEKTRKQFERTHGYLNTHAVEEAFGLGIVTERVARYVIRVLEVEASTRRTGRRDLTSATLGELDNLREQASVRLVSD